MADEALEMYHGKPQVQRTVDISNPDVITAPVLRDAQRNELDYQQLRESIKSCGVLEPVLMSPAPLEGGKANPDLDSKELVLVNGLQRMSCCQDLGFTKIPANIISLSEEEILVHQITTNCHGVDQKQSQVAEHIKRLYGSDFNLTLDDIAEKFKKSPSWVSRMLKLSKLIEPVRKYVDEGKITASNAVALAKVAAEKQPDFVQAAMTKKSDEFTAEVTEHVRAEAARKRGEKGEVKFEPTPKLQTKDDIISEIDNPSVGPSLIASQGPETLEEAFLLGLKWCIHMDPVTLAQKEAEWQQKRQEQEERRRRRQEERERAKQEAAEQAEAEVAAATGSD